MTKTYKNWHILNKGAQKLCGISWLYSHFTGQWGVTDAQRCKRLVMNRWIVATAGMETNSSLRPQCPTELRTNISTINLVGSPWLNCFYTYHFLVPGPFADLAHPLRGSTPKAHKVWPQGMEDGSHSLTVQRIAVHVIQVCAKILGCRTHQNMYVYTHAVLFVYLYMCV